MDHMPRCLPRPVCTTCRFQYITLANYIAKGVCPSKDSKSRTQEYDDLYSRPEDWNEYYRDSSRALNTATTAETCFCEQEKVITPEYRVLTYRDAQVTGLTDPGCLKSRNVHDMETEAFCRTARSR